MAESVIQGIWTDDGRTALAQSVLGPLVRPPYKQSFFKYFKIGEGGFITGAGGSKAPKSIEASQSDLDSESDSNLFTFQKEFEASDLSFSLEGGVPFAIARAFVDLNEANDDGFGNSPEFFEVGIFDENDVLLVYATFPGETKNAAKTLNHIIKCNF